MNDQNWTTITSKEIYKDRWFSILKDSCQLPDGRIYEPYYTIQLPDWCNTVIVTENNEMIFVQQYRYPSRLLTIELAGGVIEPNENPIDAAKREMEEETGYTSSSLELLYQASPNPAINNNTAYFYLATNATPIHSLNLDEFEEINVLTFNKLQVLQMLADNQFHHGVQIGVLYAALLKLGWITVAD